MKIDQIGAGVMPNFPIHDIWVTLLLQRRISGSDCLNDVHLITRRFTATASEHKTATLLQRTVTLRWNLQKLVINHHPQWSFSNRSIDLNVYQFQIENLTSFVQQAMQKSRSYWNNINIAFAQPIWTCNHDNFSLYFISTDVLPNIV